MGLTDLNKMCIFPPGSAFVLNLPKDFDLIQEMKNAVSIRLATAFARESGLILIEEGIKASNSKIKLLTGLDFNSTEPQVLIKWFEFSKNKNIRAKIFNVKNMNFHPKVLVIEKNENSFAIVGSGNLSSGGLQSNVECSIYTEDIDIISSLIEWYDYQFDIQSIDLNAKIIEDYKKIYKKENHFRRMAKKNEHSALDVINKSYKSSMEQWQKAVRNAIDFSKTNKFKELYASHKDAAQRIKKEIDYPNFEFDKNGLDAFYKIGNLGHLLSFDKSNILKNKEKVGKALRYLINETIPISVRFNAIQGRNADEYYVDGLGPNFMTKILAVHRPDLYPVKNKPIERALKLYKYSLQRGADAGVKYEKLAELMRKFIQDSRLPDMLALDAFLYIEDEKIK